MKVFNSKVVQVKVGERIRIKKNGEKKVDGIFAKIGLNVEVDGVKVHYSFKHQTYSVKYPDRTLAYKSGSPNGETEKGQKFGGMTRANFVRSFGKTFVDLVDSEMFSLLAK